jgi:tocopherol O-methyltransferase
MELKDRVRQHFDVASPFYQKLWGDHIHHGYWRNGSESKELAQEQLIDELVSRAYIRDGSNILDVGCGIGGTAFYLERKHKAQVTGITLSPVQADMAKKFASEHGSSCSFLVMDGENITLTSAFDIVWTIEVISHYYDKKKFFSSAARLLKSGGRVAMAVWLKAEHLTSEQETKYIRPILY